MMGCFFTCFKFKPNDPGPDDVFIPPPHASSSHSSKTRHGFNLVPQEQIMSRNRLSSMFLSEDRESSCGQDSLDRELKNEANLLKACGALLETPAEIRRASKRINDQNEEESFKKIQWDEQTEPTLLSSLLNADDSDYSLSNSKRYADEPTRRGSQHRSALSSLMSGPQFQLKPFQFDGVKNNLGALMSGPQFQLKPFQFDGVKNNLGAQTVVDFSPCETSTPQIGHQRQLHESRQSPYPTPLKLTDEMQTPATAYPTNHDNVAAMKNGRVRSQYVYPIHNQDDPCQPGHPESTFNQDTLADRAGSQVEEFSFADGSSETPDSCNKDGKNLTPVSTMPSLSQWLKPPIPEEERRRIREAAMKDSSPTGKSSDVDRPIIGIVAAHWNGDEPTQISPKWWDGNGIPNSTNKYKEDQKVSWHATPFEERLEKALSGDNQQLPAWKLKAKPINFDEEGDECDTAAS